MEIIETVGAFYTNVTLRGPSQDAAVAALAGREAFVSPEVDGSVVVFDEKSEEQAPEVVTALAARLSSQFSCPALAVLNHDDDVLYYVLYEAGVERDRYDSTPGYDGDDPSAPPEGGNASILCAAFGSGELDVVGEILRTPARRATYRHAALLQALGLQSWAAGLGYDYIVQGECAPELEARLVKTM